MTKSKSNVKADFVLPIAVLTLICLIASGILAFLNSVTAPVIEETEAQIAAEARMEVLPEADDFTKLDLDLTDSFVTEAYAANNGAGYVFMITCNGYGGKKTMNLICGMDADGNIVSTKTLSHAETAGLGSKTTEDDWRSRFVGVNGDTLADVDTIGGATFSSTYYKEGIASAFEAYRQIAEGGKA